MQKRADQSWVQLVTITLLTVVFSVYFLLKTILLTVSHTLITIVKSLLNINLKSNILGWTYRGDWWNEICFIWEDQFLKFCSKCGFNRFRKLINVGDVISGQITNFNHSVDSIEQLLELKSLIININDEIVMINQIIQFYKGKNKLIPISFSLRIKEVLAEMELERPVISKKYGPITETEHLSDEVDLISERIHISTNKENLINEINSIIRNFQTQMREADVDDNVRNIYDSPILVIGIVKIILLFLSAENPELILVSVLLTVFQQPTKNKATIEFIDVFLEVELYGSVDEDIKFNYLFTTTVCNLLVKTIFILIDSDMIE